MPRQSKSVENETTMLLRYLLAIELWRGGLSQAQIRTRLGLSMGTVNQMLKGVGRELYVRVEP